LKILVCSTPMSNVVPNFNGLSFLGVRCPTRHSVLDDIDGSSEYLVVWGPYCQCYDIPSGSLRTHDTVVEPGTFVKGGDFRVYVDQKWWPVEDITFWEGGMTVTYKSPNVSQRKFKFSEMKWDLSFR